MATKTPDGMIKFRVRITRIETKDVEVTATDMYKAQSIGKSLARKYDWQDVDDIAYSALAEPWFFGEKKRR
jgi:hypothetical protein